MKEYLRWLETDLEDKDLTEELLAVKGNDEEINDRFYRELEFGTGGLRGVIGAGTNRINVYTVAKATQGLANYLNSHNDDNKKLSVAIAYDSRIKGVDFANVSARVLAANGIKAYIYKELMPTPALSFAVRYLKCDAGICVTASHNPAKYNGYKAYGSDGCQVTSDMADGIMSEINKTDIFEDIKKTSFNSSLESGMIEY
ncbi:MAG: phospho-sugar mutase, partial [Clostridia bacterium]